jgi:NADPH-dependent 2,4-dienoyl-CoA reductase/sulfur reductase-like enzyme
MLQAVESGMQAALTAAKRGHRVILCEKSGRLGGVLRCEEEVPFKKHLRDYLDRQELMISRAPIEVRLNTEATPELARRLEPDVIIAALGSEPLIPNIRGVDGKNVIGAVELYKNPERAGGRIAVLGGGLVGCELGIYMAGSGRDVAIIEMAPTLNDGGNILQGQSVAIEIERLGVRLALSTRALEINERGVAARKGEERVFIEADTVVLAAGLKPLRAQAAALNLCAPEFYQIGDCVGPANIYRATNAAYHVAMDIGRL